MSGTLWSFLLQWSRVGIGAVVFLIAARHLSLAEIGLFATAYAPVRLIQGLHKVGISEAVVILGDRPKRLEALFALSLTSGLLLALVFASIGFAFGQPLLSALGAIPMLHGLSAVSEGVLRKRLQLRALALRTATAQTLGAFGTLWLLFEGWGAWALVAFALITTLIGCALSLAAARWWPDRWGSWKHQSLILPKVTLIAIRDLIQSGLLPLLQLAIGLAISLPAAGAFQIATRMLGLIDALGVSPLRFVALPQLTEQRIGGLQQTMRAQLRATARLSAWLWGGTLVATAQIVSLAVGPTHAAVVAPILQALVPFGLIAALLMPLTQGLIARKQVGLVLTRVAALMATALLMCLPMLTLSTVACAAALSMASLITAIWHIPVALNRLELTYEDLLPALPPLAAALMMVAVVASPILSQQNLTEKVLVGTAVYLGCLTLWARRPYARVTP